MDYKFINLTPHKINVAGKTIEPSGTVARVKIERTLLSTLDDIPIYITVPGPIIDLPEEELDTLYIVSAMVRTHEDCRYRYDVLSPGNLVRDDQGNIIGCDGLDVNLFKGNHS